ncbi:hypothetical protein RI367_006714 [Sorochytrium milnesiophthora]
MERFVPTFLGRQRYLPLVSDSAEQAQVSAYRRVSSCRDVRIERTPLGRPFCLTAPCDFNVSHHGCWVACVLPAPSHADLAVGVDVANINIPKEYACLDYISIFKDQLHASEWSMLATTAQAQGAEAAKLAFARIWALKEAVIKAFGVGLQLKLAQVEFTLAPPAAAASSFPRKISGGTTVAFHEPLPNEILGVPMRHLIHSSWTLDEYLLDDDSVMAVALPHRLPNQTVSPALTVLSMDDYLATVQ